MNRPHIEFIQSQNIQWKILPESTARAGSKYKILSRDSVTGAVSVIINYPSGFEISKQHYLDNVEEFFVLDGSISIGEITFKKHSYAFLPKGFPRKNFFSKSGAVVLTFFEGPHKNVFEYFKNFDDSEVVIQLDTSETKFISNVDPKVVGSNMSKLVLREDKKTGERTWILRMGPSEEKEVTSARLETHPNVEEMFLIDGEISMPTGILRSGAYFWRPGGIQHGPVGTRKGCVLFFRCKGGPFETFWSKELHKIIWDAPYNPIIPSDLSITIEVNNDFKENY